MASNNQFKRYKNMHVLAQDLTLTGDLAVAGTTTITGDTAVADDDSLILGTGGDTELLWSTGDASNHAAVVALGASQALHITDVGAKATDWNVSADTNPTLYIHSDTTPATDYLKLGAHSGTAADIDLVGGATLNLKIGGTAEVLMTASILDLTSTDLQVQASGQILDDNGNELIEFKETASAVNGLRIVNAATGNKPTITNEGEADTGLILANFDGTNTEPIVTLQATASATNGLRIVNNTTGLNPIITPSGEADTGITLAGYDGSNTEEILVLDAVASAVNELKITNAATGNPVAIAATGDDTDVGITVASKGAGYTRVTTGGFQVHSTAAVTATADGTGTGLIPAGTSFVVVTSDNADKQISLPAGTVGDRMRILVGATGCELIAVTAGDKVNDVVVGATNEAALTATNLYDCQYVATNTWVVIGYTKLGAVQAALVPDAR